MILCQFNDHRLGVVEGGLVRDVTAVLHALPSHRYPFLPGDALIAALPDLRDRRILAAAAQAPAVPVARGTRGCSVPSPTRAK